MAPSKRPRTRASKRATKPTYAQLEDRLRDAERRNAQLEDENARLRDEVTNLRGADRDAAGGVSAEETLSAENMQGRKWKELFVSSDVFREHIQPELGETWTAILMEACGQATSKTVSQVERKTMDAKEATRSVAMYEWCCARGYVRQVQHNEAHVTKTKAAQQLERALDEGSEDESEIEPDAYLRMWKDFDEVARERRFTVRNASMWGDVALVKILHENGCPWNKETCSQAAKGGHLDVLKYAHENGCPWDEETCYWAARKGHLDVLKYAHEHGCPWDEETCFMAASEGHLHVLKYARENGCPWDEYTCDCAAEGGHLVVLKYAHENGCPWNSQTCCSAASGGHLDVLKYAHENGCPWDVGTCSSATWGGHLHVLKYARENGCPWNRRDCRVRASKGGHTHVVSWIDSQPSLD